MSSSASTTAVNEEGKENKISDNGPANQVETNATVNPSHRKRRLMAKAGGVNPLKYKAWVAGHIMCIVFGFISVIFQLLRLPNKYYINSISYRLSLFGAVMALGATISRKYGFAYLPPFSTLVAQQNFQFSVLACIWVFTFKSIFKLLPYLIISTLQLASEKKIQPVLKQSSELASLIAFDELFLIFYLLIRTIFFRNTSGFQFIIFSVFYWLRIMFNDETRTLFRTIIARLDGKVSGVKNEKVQHMWKKTKMFIAEKGSDA
ncbi:Piso0_002433 [Millerozyma farinosa CBS 7064]|uniref:Piso0_002433 protein n=1 Tax=Pichia sorbitophila (strain ATCC MYA-4447 / BCRC 22081 / CBS 7064 / NBRC 10061 / NRRL Y-12695) TaxID=559304 RepID=G8YCL4_PICSO|nr:Piso0_002433 [Millerozyma farinosa CBS 7064]